MCLQSLRPLRLVLLLPLALYVLTVSGQAAVVAPQLSVKQIMDVLITPPTAVIWGAYELASDAQWEEVEQAALTVLAAGELLANGGNDPGAALRAEESDWQAYNGQMMRAARAVLLAVSQRDEEALFNAGNDALYPPCESCHQAYQTR